MTSKRTLAKCLAFAAGLTILALWMALKDRPAPTLAIVFFSPVIPLVIWSVAAYRKKLWAWYAAVAALWVSIFFLIAMLIWPAYILWERYRFNVDTIWLFAICWFFVFGALVMTCRSGMPELRRQREQFVYDSSPEVSPQSTRPTNRPATKLQG
jgi:hypothetical protein